MSIGTAIASSGSTYTVSNCVYDSQNNAYAAASHALDSSGVGWWVFGLVDHARECIHDALDRLCEIIASLRDCIPATASRAYSSPPMERTGINTASMRASEAKAMDRTSTAPTSSRTSESGAADRSGNYKRTCS